MTARAFEIYDIPSGYLPVTQAYTNDGYVAAVTIVQGDIIGRSVKAICDFVMRYDQKVANLDARLWGVKGGEAFPKYAFINLWLLPCALVNKYCKRARMKR